MVYLIYGSTQDLLIEKQTNNIIKSNSNGDEVSNITYFLDDTPLKDVITDCSAMPLFGSNKIIVLKKAELLFNYKDNEELNMFVNYLNNPSEFVTLIIVVKGPLDEKSEVSKKLLETAKLVQISEVAKSEWSSLIIQLINQYNISFDEDAKEEFIARTQGNVTTVVNELRKLKSLNERITKDIIFSFVSRPLDDNMLGMADYILQKDYKSAFHIFYDIKNKNQNSSTGNDPIAMISYLASNFRFIYQCAILQQEGLSNEEIANKFPSNVKPGRVYYALKNVREGTTKTILDILSKLADLDYKIKTNQIDKYVGFEMFLISLERGENND